MSPATTIITGTDPGTGRRRDWPVADALVSDTLRHLESIGVTNMSVQVPLPEPKPRPVHKPAPKAKRKR